MCKIDVRISCRSAERGVTLIELMVGLVLGLVVVLVVAQVLGFSEGQKRNTTGGADAQVNGALALYSLQREIQMAGYGLVNNLSAVGCPIRANHATGGSFTWNLAPLLITDGQDGAPDTISIVSSNRAYSVPMVVSVNHPNTSDRFTVRSALGAKAGDLVIAVPPAPYDPATSWCVAYAVTGVVNGNQVMHESSNKWNGGQVAPALGFPAGSSLVNAGSFTNRIFSITNKQSLQQQTLNTNTAGIDTQELFPQIVNLQALYGRDTNGDGVVDQYDNATPANNALWQQVLSVRLAVVARSTTYSKDKVTTAQPSWDVGTAIPVSGAVTCGASKCITLKVNGPADWEHYRYSVYDVVIPLRNMVWGV